MEDAVGPLGVRCAEMFERLEDHHLTITPHYVYLNPMTYKMATSRGYISRESETVWG